MSKKQLGAAPMAESEPAAGKPNGWFGRLRAQPGFRTASIAFLLTVVLGIGSTAAYAYWSQSKSLSITGTTGYSVPSITGSPTCTSLPGANRVAWTPVPAGTADAAAVYVVGFQRTDDQQAVWLAVPAHAAEVFPYHEHAVYHGLGRSDGVDLSVTVRTAVLKSPTNTVRQINPATDILQESAASLPAKVRYTALMGPLTAGFKCR